MTSFADIRPEWVDVPTPPELRTCLPRTDRLGATWPVYEEAVPIIPRSEWSELIGPPERSLRPLVQRIKNQGQEGSCASNACSGAAETLQVKQWGAFGWVELSAISLYKRVASSAQSGSTINDNIREINSRGILPADTLRNREFVAKGYFRHVHPNTGFNLRLPDGWEETAIKFRVTEWWDIGSVEGMVSAWLRGMPVFYGRAGHAIFMVDVRLDGSRAMLCYANSWGEWGDHGFGWDTEAYVQSAISTYGAVAPRTMTDWRDGLLPQAA